MKVIIVDDDKLLGTTLTLGLEGLGMKPYYLNSLDGLLDKISEVHPNILVLDVEIGSGNGIEELKELKLHAIHIPVIIMSSHIQMDYISEALANGAFHFMKKPFEIVTKNWTRWERCISCWNNNIRWSNTSSFCWSFRFTIF